MQGENLAASELRSETEAASSDASSPTSTVPVDQSPQAEKVGPETLGADDEGWKDIVRKYQKPSKRRSIWQIVNTLVPYFALWTGIYFLLPISAWLTIPLIVVAGLLLVRIFVIFHDCTHGSFFKSKRANEVVGFVMGTLAFTPYHHWRWEHSVHHSAAGDLDRRGMGDVWTLTIEEYLESSRWRRFSYRLSRNPIVLFVLAPLTLFVVLHRVPAKGASPRMVRWLMAANAALLAMIAGGCLVFGFWTFILLQLAVLGIASASGVWLFYVQHQFEDVYWDRQEDWDFTRAALEGSSFYKLPKILQWFSGNIGFHHIHHLSPRIPNYQLEKAHHAEPMFQTVKPLTMRKSLKSATFRLWDEGRRKLTTYRPLKGRARVKRNKPAA